jgi:hypothetical protein
MEQQQQAGIRKWGEVRGKEERRPKMHDTKSKKLQYTRSSNSKSHTVTHEAASKIDSKKCIQVVVLKTISCWQTVMAILQQMSVDDVSPKRQTS